jgi:hypothetical protein
MFTRKEHVEGSPYWIDLHCSKCNIVETFGTASVWADGELTALIGRMRWKLNPDVCPKCSRPPKEPLDVGIE